MSRIGRPFLWQVAIVTVAICAPQLSSAQLHYVEMKATSMLYCPQDGRIYATGAPDAKGALANSVCRINPNTGKVEASVFVGSNPKGIIRTADGKTLYVLVADNKMVRQVDRATLTTGINFPIGQDQAARKIACVPEVPDALIVHRYNPSISPQFDNLCVFVKGQAKMEGVPCGNNFAYGIDPSRVLTSSEGSCSNFFFGVNAMLHTDEGPSLSNGTNMPLVTNGYGLVISSQGFVIDPEAHQNLGRIPVDSDQICVDPVRPVAYEVFKELNKPKVRCFDLQTFRELWKSPLADWPYEVGPSCPLRYGVSGFAYIDGDFIVCGPWNLGKPSEPVDLSINRSGFPKGSLEGRTFTYTLTIQNNSDAPSTGTYVTDTIPGVVDVQEVQASQGNANFAQGAIRAELGSIPGHGTATVKVKLHVQSRGNGGYVAVVRSFDPDPDTTNNIYPGTSFVPHAKLEMGTPTPEANSDPDILSGTWKTLEREAKGAGENLSIQIDGSLVIKNNGKQSTHPMSVRFYIQEGPNLVIDWAVLLQEVQVPSIGPGKTYTVDLQAPFDTNVDVVGLYVVANIDPLKVNGPPSNVSHRIN